MDSMGKLVAWFRVREYRMEVYTAAAALVTILSLSHILGYWPYGMPAATTAPQRSQIDPQTKAVAVSAQDIFCAFCFSWEPLLLASCSTSGNGRKLEACLMAESNQAIQMV